MNTFAIDHPAGEQYELDWHDEGQAPSNGQLSDILAAHTGRPPLSPADANPPPPAAGAQSVPGNVLMQAAVQTGNPSSNLQLASGRPGDPALGPEGQHILHMYDTAPVEPKDTNLKAAKEAFRPNLVHVLQKYGTNAQIQKAPASVRAYLYALTNISDPAYGRAGTVTDPTLPTAGAGDWKCNLFVAKSYALGGGIGYKANGKSYGYPTTPHHPYGITAFTHNEPPVADALSDPHTPIDNFKVTPTPQAGDVFAFHSNPGGQHGHSGLYLGNGMGIYAGRDGIKLGTMGYVQQQDGLSTGPKYRTYTPGH